jgi:hypothetical protein
MYMNIICFGQQPCGFFPKRYLVAKINTARTLQKEIGGKIIFFYHDSDADYRETITIMNDLKTGAEVRLNFTQENKIQKKFSPLYLKRIPNDWKEEILKQLPRFLSPSSPSGRGQGEGLIDIFQSVDATTVADFCLEMYQKMGLLEGVEIVRSSDKNFRAQTSEIENEFFADIPFENEIVRAQFINNEFKLHEGGGKYLTVPTPPQIDKVQKNPGKDERFKWMNSVIGATHYIAGNSEFEYLKRDQFPEVKFIKRDAIIDQDKAWLY